MNNLAGKWLLHHIHEWGIIQGYANGVKVVLLYYANTSEEDITVLL